MGFNILAKAVPTPVLGDWAVLDVQGALELGFSIVPDGGALTDFRIYGTTSDSAVVAERIPIAVIAGDYTTPLWPLRRASGSLITLADDTLGFVFLNVAGIAQIVLQAKAAAGGVTITLRGQVN